MFRNQQERQHRGKPFFGIRMAAGPALAIALASITRKAEETPARHFPDIGTIDLRLPAARTRPLFRSHGRVVRLGDRTPAGLMN